MSILDTLMFWKHKEKEEVIKQECYDKLPEHRKVNYTPTNQEPTHIVEQVDRTSDDDDGILISTIATVAALEMLNADAPISGPDYSGYDAPDTNNFQGFDGGSSGGAGASGDWGLSSDNSSYDGGSSFDSGGSTYDGGSSFDSSGSSFDSSGSSW